MTSKQRKRIQDIERIARAHVLAVDVLGNGHTRLTFSRGHVVISSSPSCPFATKRAAADVKRLAKKKANK